METPDPKNFIVYQGPSGAVAVSAYIKDETDMAYAKGNGGAVRC